MWLPMAGRMCMDPLVKVFPWAPGTVRTNVDAWFQEGESFVAASTIATVDMTVITRTGRLWHCFGRK